MTLDEYLANMKTFDNGFSAMSSGNYDFAIELFKQVLKKDPKHVQSFGNLGLAYACKGMRAKALECLEKALQLDPEYELAMGNKLNIENNMKEGEPINFDGSSVDYYKDFGRENNQSYLSDMTAELQNDNT